MIFDIPQEAKEIISVLENHGFEAYLVGGCVRDILMGIQPKDYDICTSAHTDRICAIFKKTVKTGIRHGTVTVMKNNVPYEVTTFRIESGYTDHRHPDVVHFSSSLTEDLTRRDFTINALAYHPQKGIIDPFHGIRDIRAKRIQTVGKPKDRFGEDALRMLRAVRFQARFGFDIHPETKKAIGTLGKMIQYVSRERILSEINGILTGSYPEKSNSLFETGIIRYILPVTASTPDMRPLKQLPNRLPVRWAAFIWQMGLTDMDAIRGVCHRLKMSNALKNHILMISGILSKPLPKNEFLLKKALSSVGVPIFLDSLQILRATGCFDEFLYTLEPILQKIIREKHCIHLSGMAVSGKDLIALGYKPGKHIGEILDILLLCVLQRPELNRRDILLLFARYLLVTLLFGSPGVTSYPYSVSACANYTPKHGC